MAGNQCVRLIIKFMVQAYGYMRQIAENTKTNKQQDETAIPSLMQNPTPQPPYQAQWVPVGS